MHNLRPTSFSFAASYTDFRKGLRSKRANFLDKEHLNLFAAHNNFNFLAGRKCLNKLTSIYKRPGKKEDFPDSDYWVAHDLYDRIDKEEYNKALESVNGGKKLLCPICGLREVHHLDHYAPREKFPELSCHYTNLIPACGECNEPKSTLWTDSLNRQLIFNAFFDTDIPEEIMSCRISRINGVAWAEVRLSPTLLPSNPQHFRIAYTIEKLNLIQLYEDRINARLRDFLDLVGAEWSVSGSMYPSFEAFVESRRECLRDLIKINENKASQLANNRAETAYNLLFFRGLICSTDFRAIIEDKCQP